MKRKYIKIPAKLTAEKYIKYSIIYKVIISYGNRVEAKHII